MVERYRLVSACRQASRPLAAMLAALLVTGCAVVPQSTSLAAAGMTRIAIAQPEDMYENKLPGELAGSFAMPSVHRQLCDTLAAGLRAKQFVVIDHCSTPNKDIVAGLYGAPRMASGEADVLLIPVVRLRYTNGGEYGPSNVESITQYVLYDLRTRAYLEIVGIGPGTLSPPAARFATVAAAKADPARVESELKRVAAHLGRRMADAVR